MDITHTLNPDGPLGSLPLPVLIGDDYYQSAGFASGASARFDWYNDRLQILVNDGQNDDLALHVRFNADGSVAEILVRNDLLKSVKPESSTEVSPWQFERDQH